LGDALEGRAFGRGRALEVGLRVPDGLLGFGELFRHHEEAEGGGPAEAVCSAGFPAVDGEIEDFAGLDFHAGDLRGEGGAVRAIDDPLGQPALL
jgi:hypothetical protein